MHCSPVICNQDSTQLKAQHALQESIVEADGCNKAAIQCADGSIHAAADTDLCCFNCQHEAELCCMFKGGIRPDWSIINAIV